MRLSYMNFAWEKYTAWRPNHMKVLFPDETLLGKPGWEGSNVQLPAGDHLWPVVTGSREAKTSPRDHDLKQDGIRYAVLAQLGIESLVGMVTVRHTQLKVTQSGLMLDCGHFWCDVLPNGTHQRLVVEFYPSTLENVEGITAVGAFLHPFADPNKVKFEHEESIPIGSSNIKLILIPLSDGRVEVLKGTIVDPVDEDTSYRGQGLMDQDNLERFYVYPRRMPTVWLDDTPDRIRFVLVCIQDADQFGIVPAHHFGVPLHIERRSGVNGDQAFASRRWQVWRFTDSDHVEGQIWSEYRSVPEYLPLLQVA